MSEASLYIHTYILGQARLWCKHRIKLYGGISCEDHMNTFNQCTYLCTYVHRVNPSKQTANTPTHSNNIYRTFTNFHRWPIFIIFMVFRGCRRQPLYCFHLDFRCVTLVRYIYIYIYNMDLKKSLIIENLYNSNREV